MPDADLTVAVPALLGSAFGNAGERCLAGSVAVAVGAASRRLLEPLRAQTSTLVVGPGGPAGGRRGAASSGLSTATGWPATSTEEWPRGHRSWWTAGPTCSARDSFSARRSSMRCIPPWQWGGEEIFGPVLSVAHVQTLEEAIAHANRMSLGNMAVIFTRDGRAAREFRDSVEAGMVV